MIESEDRNFVTALARGLDVLRCFKLGEPELTNTQIAARTGLPKPTVSRLTYTLRKLGYLVQVEPNGTYRLGVGILALGYGALAGVDIAERAAEIMRDLAAGPNPYVTCGLGERHKLSAVYVAIHRSDEAVSLTVRVGRRLPLLKSALGRAIVCGMNEGELDYMYRRIHEDAPEMLDMARDDAESARAEYAEHGFCRSIGDWKPEINGIAVPIRALNGDRIYGMNIGGPSFLLSEDELMREYAPRLLDAGERLSRKA